MNKYIECNLCGDVMKLNVNMFNELMYSCLNCINDIIIYDDDGFAIIVDNKE